jgi:hypothetical protein
MRYLASVIAAATMVVALPSAAQTGGLNRLTNVANLQGEWTISLGNPEIGYFAIRDGSIILTRPGTRGLFRGYPANAVFASGMRYVQSSPSGSNAMIHEFTAQCFDWTVADGQARRGGERTCSIFVTERSGSAGIRANNGLDGTRRFSSGELAGAPVAPQERSSSSAATMPPRVLVAPTSRRSADAERSSTPVTQTPSQTGSLNRQQAQRAAQENQNNVQNAQTFRRQQEEHNRAVAEAEAARRAYQADLAANTAEREAYARRRAQWEADVRACNAGDRSRCGTAAPR